MINSEQMSTFSHLQKLWAETNDYSPERLRSLIEIEVSNPNWRNRFFAEFTSLGPLEELWQDESITEILINSFDSIWVERLGKLQLCDLGFFSPTTYLQFLERITHEVGVELTIQTPFIETRFRQARMTIIGAELTKSQPVVSFRKWAFSPWSLQRLFELNWCTRSQLDELKKVIATRANFLVAGATGSGKTSLLSAMLTSVESTERCLVIEDTEEITLPNSASLRLLTRQNRIDGHRQFDQCELIKRALRLRPDRLILGEVRGEEAKDLLMALSSGHSGSFGSLHAQDPHQALYRLETLIQMGAPQWSLTTVRRLIQLGVNYILTVEKTSSGLRQFSGCYRICSLEETGFCIEKAF